MIFKRIINSNLNVIKLYNVFISISIFIYTAVFLQGGGALTPPLKKRSSFFWYCKSRGILYLIS